MNLYLVQHGEAEAERVDPARPLTGRGRADVVSVARRAARLALEVEQIRHSGKTRAEQTAAILGEALSPRGGVVEAPGLAPMDNVGPIGDALAREEKPLMLVGHLPFMARLAALLVGGNPERPVVQFRNAGIVALSRENAHWLFAWNLTPELAAARDA